MGEGNHGWHEECGVFGVYSHTEDVAGQTFLGLYALQHRGQESGGIAVTNGSWMEVSRGMGLVSEVFKRGLPHIDDQCIAIGHVRYSTTGSSLLANTQPLVANYLGGKISLAHNGNLTNTASLRRKLECDGVMFHTTVDTEVILNLIARSRKKGVEERLRDSLSQIEGAYCLVLMTEKKLIGARDPHGFRPLCLGRTPCGGWVLSSESCGLTAVGASFVRDVEPGEMVVIDNDNADVDAVTSIRFAPKIPLAVCVFEYIYFARSDSILDGQSVHDARFMMGRILARESSYIKGDIVISVPDSGTAAATGYAFESGIPFVEGLTKNRYVGRTFIQPTQKKRAHAVSLKLTPNRTVVEGKSVIMVDDSIVRGTTSGKIVRMLRDAGAREVHMCVSSPPIGYPCYYGIDTSVRKELIASTKTVEEIRQYINADTLHFLSLDGLKRAITALDPNAMCYACFNGDYPLLPTSTDKYAFEEP